MKRNLSQTIVKYHNNFHWDTKWDQEELHGEPDGVNAFIAIYLGETSKWQ